MDYGLSGCLFITRGIGTRIGGDEHAGWGTSVWFFEVGEDGFPTRQIEVYQSGVILRYDEENSEDEFGGLAQASLDPEEFLPYFITAEEFEAAWVSKAG